MERLRRIVRKKFRVKFLIYFEMRVFFWKEEFIKEKSVQYKLMLLKREGRREILFKHNIVVFFTICSGSKNGASNDFWAKVEMLDWKVWSYAKRVIPIATEIGRETTLCAQRPVRIHTRPHQVRHKDDPPPPAQRCPMNPFRVFPPQPTLFLILQGIGEILAPVLDIWRGQKCRSI